MKFTFLLVLVFYAFTGFSQQIDSLKANDDIKFANYLLNTHQFSDAVFLLDQLDFNSRELVSFKDTLNYLKGWAFYSMKSLDSASIYFLRTNPSTFSGVKSHFFAAYNCIYLRNEDLGIKILNSLKLKDPKWVELKYLQKAGIALLKRNPDQFLQLKSNFSDTWYSLTDAENKLNKDFNRLKLYKRKSPWIAGCMSMIVPGSGKIYAGKFGEGIADLLSNAILGAITVENYKKAGLQNFKTIFFGTLFSIFYMGNVYGSMISAQVTNNDFNTIFDNEVLFDIHIPLRTIFD